MTGERQRLPDFLGHILQAIERIERYTDGMDEADFLRSEIAPPQRAIIAAHRP